MESLYSKIPKEIWSQAGKIVKAYMPPKGKPDIEAHFRFQNKAFPDNSFHVVPDNTALPESAINVEHYDEGDKFGPPLISEEGLIQAEHSHGGIITIEGFLEFLGLTAIIVDPGGLPIVFVPINK